VEAELYDAQTGQGVIVLQSQLAAARTELEKMTNIANVAQQQVGTVTNVKNQLIAEKTEQLHSALIQSSSYDQQIAEMNSLLATEKQKTSKVDDLEGQVSLLKENLKRTIKDIQDFKHVAQLAEATLKLLREKNSATISELKIAWEHTKEKSEEVALFQLRQVEMESQLSQLVKNIGMVRTELKEKTRVAAEAQEKVVAMTRERNRIMFGWQVKLDQAAARYKLSENKIKKITVGLEAVRQEALKAESLQEQVVDLTARLEETKASMRVIREQAAKAFEVHREKERITVLELAAMKEKLIEIEKKSSG